MVAVHLPLFLAVFLPVVARDSSLNALRGLAKGKPEHKTGKYVVHTENVITRHPPTAEEGAAVDAVNAHRAADSAVESAKIASKVAARSADITEAATSALHDVRKTLQAARTKVDGVTVHQEETLKRAETQMNVASDLHKTGYETSASRYVKAGDASAAPDADDVKKLRKLQRELDATFADADAHSREGEILRMEADIQSLKGDLAARRSDAESTKEVGSELAEIEAMVREFESADRGQGHDELKVTVERLRQRVRELEAQHAAKPPEPDAGRLHFELPTRKELPLREVEEASQAKLPLREVAAECTPSCL